MTQLQKRQPGPIQAIKGYLDQRVDLLRQWVQDRIEPETLIRFALKEVQQSKQLQRCTPASIYLALLGCAQAGLEPGGYKNEAYIVPYRDQATFQLGWRGIVKLAMRSGEVRKLTANVVYEGDSFEFDLGTNAYVTHKPTTLPNRGEIIGAYAYAQLKSGDLDVEWMGREDLDKVRRQATRGGKESPAWAGWEDQMFRKAPLRRLGKRLPLGSDYMGAARLDELAEGRDIHGYRQALREAGADLEDSDDVIDVESAESEATE